MMTIPTSNHENATASNNMNRSANQPAGNTRNTIPIGHVFDVDPRTGFMATQPPISRLPEMWEEWERVLDAATQGQLQIGDKKDLTENEAKASEVWRAQVRMMPVLPVTQSLLSSPILLRRAHLVLTFLLHFYVQTLPPSEPVIIPRPISIPILQVSSALDIPPLLTFSDTVLYNWDFKMKPQIENTESVDVDLGQKPKHDLDNFRSQTMFTGLIDEEEFYLCSARIELRGVEALELIRQTMDEMFVGDDIAIRRISGYLKTMAGVINEMKTLLLDVRKHCDPEVYYNQVRPWFRGEDSDLAKRKWVYEGIGEVVYTGAGAELGSSADDKKEKVALKKPLELSGPSAGQSSLIHVLDVFLGVDHQSKSTPDKPSFMSRMLAYMPRNHRLFLKHLSANPTPLRAFVVSTGNKEFLEAFNEVVLALKEFRDAHMIIATLYIIGPARRAAKAAAKAVQEPMALKDRTNVAAESETVDLKEKEPLKGTGGTDLVKFLKGTRDRTGATVVPLPSGV